MMAPRLHLKPQGQVRVRILTGIVTLENEGTCGEMPHAMMQTFPKRLMVALSVLLLGVLVCMAPAVAQDTKPDGNDTKKEDESKTWAEKPPIRDGHDRPTTYPKIHFGKTKKADAGEQEKPAVQKDLKTRVYLLDVSAVMSKSITVNDTRETTRLEHMISQMESSLDYLVNRKDPRLRFNIVTFGSVQDFAEGGELQAATEDNARRAKEWLKKLEAKGESNMYNMLRECFEQQPDSATMIVGGKPGEPKDLSEELEKERKQYKDAGEFLLAQVKRWRKDGRSTTLDITGIGLSADEKEYYKRLADAAGGTYLDA